MIKVNSLPVYFFSFAFMALLMIIFYHIPTEHKELNFACAAHLEHVDEVNATHLNTNVIINFTKDGKGMLTFDGKVNFRGKDHKLSRVIKFHYDYFGQDTYTIRNKETITYNKDTLSLNMFEDLYFSGEAFFVSSLSGMGNVKLIGTKIMPVFMCVID